MAAFMNKAQLSEIVHSAQSRSRFRRIILPAGVIALLIGGILAWKGLASPSANDVIYVTEPLQRGDLKITVTATGNLEPTNEVTVGSELSGTAIEVLVETNDRVSKGQVLAKLDTSKLERQRESSRAMAAAAEAKVNQAKATLVESEASLQRLQKLKTASGGKLPSLADMDAAAAAAERAKADVASAEADVRQAQANIGTNESDLEKSIIRSPIDGIILTRSIEPGQTVAATMTAPELFVVAEKLENMKLKVAVAEADVSRLKEKQKASFTVDAWPNRLFGAMVKKVEYGSTVTDNVVTYSTELEVSNDDLSLRPGMTATAEIAVAEAAGVLLAPNAAFRFNPAAVRGGAGSNTAKRTFVQSLIPGPPRHVSGKPNKEEEIAAARPSESARVWVLRNGIPSAVEVQTGLTNGRVTVVSGEGLAEGLPVIIHAQTKQP